MSKCCMCGDELGDLNELASTCQLCSHLAFLGLPYKYMKATKSLYTNGLQKCFDRKQSFYIHGTVGTGKTWLMSALMREHVKSTMQEFGTVEKAICYTDNALFVSFPWLILEIKNSNDFKTETNEMKLLDKYCNVRALFLDDIGTENMTKSARSTLFMLIERRNTMRGVMVITSNLNLGQLAKQHDERVASRIAEMCTIIKLSGVDRRI